MNVLRLKNPRASIAFSAELEGPELVGQDELTQDYTTANSAIPDLKDQGTKSQNDTYIYPVYPELAVQDDTLQDCTAVSPALPQADKVMSLARRHDNISNVSGSVSVLSASYVLGSTLGNAEHGIDLTTNSMLASLTAISVVSGAIAVYNKWKSKNIENSVALAASNMQQKSSDGADPFSMLKTARKSRNLAVQAAYNSSMLSAFSVGVHYQEKFGHKALTSTGLAAFAIQQLATHVMSNRRSTTMRNYVAATAAGRSQN